MLTHREEENFNTRVVSKNLSFQDIYIARHLLPKGRYFGLLKMNVGVSF